MCVKLGQTMNKTVFILFVLFGAVAVLLSGCSCYQHAQKETGIELANVSEIKSKEIAKKYLYKEIGIVHKEVNNNLLFESFQCLIWEEQDVYVVAIARDAILLDRLALFSGDGLLYQFGFSVVSIDDISHLLGMKAEDIVDKNGEFHFDSGSGVYLPCYVTSDGSVLEFGIDDDSVSNITEYRFMDGSKNFYGGEFPPTIEE